MNATYLNYHYFAIFLIYSGFQIIRSFAANETVTTDGSNCTTNSNSTECMKASHTGSGIQEKYYQIINLVKKNKTTIVNSAIVIGSLSALIIVYLFIRSCRLSQRRSKAKKYGVIEEPTDTDTQHLKDSDDDEENTIYLNKSRK